MSKPCDVVSKCNIVLRLLTSAGNSLAHPTFSTHSSWGYKICDGGICPQGISQTIRETGTYIITVQVNLPSFSFLVLVRIRNKCMIYVVHYM